MFSFGVLVLLSCGAAGGRVRPSSIESHVFRGFMPYEQLSFRKPRDRKLLCGDIDFIQRKLCKDFRRMGGKCALLPSSFRHEDPACPKIFVDSSFGVFGAVTKVTWFRKRKFRIATDCKPDAEEATIDIDTCRIIKTRDDIETVVKWPVTEKTWRIAHYLGGQRWRLPDRRKVRLFPRIVGIVDRDLDRVVENGPYGDDDMYFLVQEMLPDSRGVYMVLGALGEQHSVETATMFATAAMRLYYVSLCSVILLHSRGIHHNDLSKGNIRFSLSDADNINPNEVLRARLGDVQFIDCDTASVEDLEWERSTQVKHGRKRQVTFSDAVIVSELLTRKLRAFDHVGFVKDYLLEFDSEIRGRYCDKMPKTPCAERSQRRLLRDLIHTVWAVMPRQGKDGLPEPNEIYHGD